MCPHTPKDEATILVPGASQCLSDLDDDPAIERPRVSCVRQPCRKTPRSTFSRLNSQCGPVLKVESVSWKVAWAIQEMTR